MPKDAVPLSLIRQVADIEKRLARHSAALSLGGGALRGVVSLAASETLTSNGSAHPFSTAMSRNVYAGDVDAANYDTGGHGFALNTAATQAVFSVAVGINVNTAGMTSGDTAVVRVDWPSVITSDFAFSAPTVGGFYTATQTYWLSLNASTLQDVGSFYFTCAQSSSRSAAATVTVTVTQFSWPA